MRLAIAAGLLACAAISIRTENRNLAGRACGLHDSDDVSVFEFDSAPASNGRDAISSLHAVPLSDMRTPAREAGGRVHDDVTDLCFSWPRRRSRKRRRVAALLTNAYAELHAAVSFIRRRQGDVAEIVPSIYVQGERAKKSVEAAKADETAKQAKPSDPQKPGAPSTPARPLLPEEPSDHPFGDEK